jgi:hypothetical protein
MIMLKAHKDLKFNKIPSNIRKKMKLRNLMLTMKMELTMLLIRLWLGLCSWIMALIINMKMTMMELMLP